VDRRPLLIAEARDHLTDVFKILASVKLPDPNWLVQRYSIRQLVQQMTGQRGAGTRHTC
jgi:hypothetical protein